MANFIGLNDVVIARVWCSDEEQASVNTFCYQCTEIAFSDATDDEIATDLDTLLSPLYADILNTSTKYNGVQVYKLNGNLNGTPYQPGVSVAGATFGTVTGLGLPRQTCGIISWNTSLTGRRYRGRTYLPFPPSGFDSGQGFPSTPAITAYYNIASAIRNYVLTSMTGATMEQQLYHRGRQYSTPPIPGQITPMRAWTNPAKWATQRRRGSYGRANSSPI